MKVEEITSTGEQQMIYSRQLRHRGTSKQKPKAIRHRNELRVTEQP